MAYGGPQGSYGGGLNVGIGPGNNGGVKELLMQQKISIPTVCAGNVIGRGGSVISGIRKQSGTFISIAVPAPDSPSERLVTITGPTAHSIQSAVNAIRQIVEAPEHA